jgi:hypothetical protein
MIRFARISNKKPWQNCQGLQLTHKDYFAPSELSDPVMNLNC